MKHRALTCWAAVGVIAIAIGGWVWHRERYPTWSEEVLLSDGRVIRIHQRHEYFGNYGTNQSWVTFSLPELGGERTWHSFLTPQRIDVRAGKVYAFGFPRGDRQFYHYESPKHYMVAFQWTGADFVRIPFLDVPPELRSRENIYSCVPESRSHDLSLAEKDSKWCPLRGDKWKFGREIVLTDYEALAMFYAGLRNSQPASQ